MSKSDDTHISYNFSIDVPLPGTDRTDIAIALRQIASHIDAGTVEIPFPDRDTMQYDIPPAVFTPPIRGVQLSVFTQREQFSDDDEDTA